MTEVKVRCYRCKKDKNEEDFDIRVNGERLKKCKSCDVKTRTCCIHNVNKLCCKICYGFKCPHNKTRQRCKECKKLGVGGNDLCCHYKEKYRCIDCKLPNETEKYYNSACGSKVLNREINICLHNTTKKHTNYIEKTMKPKEEKVIPDGCIECECGSIMKNHWNNIRLHKQTKKHKQFLDNEKS